MQLDRHSRFVRVLSVALLFLAITPVAVFAVPQLAGASHSYVVLSDSMEPTFTSGDAVLVAETAPEDIAAGDVVTYRRSGASSTLVTHRVVEVVDEAGERWFRTKGDANEEADGDLVASSDVVGVQTLTIPYLGHVVLFARSSLGVAVLVVLPCALLAFGEARDLLGAYRDRSGDDVDTGAGR